MVDQDEHNRLLAEYLLTKTQLEMVTEQRDIAVEANAPMLQEVLAYRQRDVRLSHMADELAEMFVGQLPPPLVDFFDEVKRDLFEPPDASDQEPRDLLPD